MQKIVICLRALREFNVTINLLIFHMSKYDLISFFFSHANKNNIVQ